MKTAERAPTALVFAPHGRDAALACALLAEAGIPAEICRDADRVAESISDVAAFVVLTAEGVSGADLRSLSRRIADQPPWSDLPIILLTHRGGGPERNPEAARLSEVLGNVSFLERPFHPTTFISVARTALRSRRRQLEARARTEEMREGEADLRTALLAGRLGSWELDVASRELTASAVCRGLFGWGADDPLTYDHLLAAVHPEDRAFVSAGLERAVAGAEDCAIEYRALTPGRPMRWAEIRARVVRDREGRPGRIVGVSSDITERKAAEASLRGANELLEQRVAERTAQLQRAHDDRLAEIEQRERAEALLHQAQKMEMIGQLTGGVAHDFNNLLMAVIGNLDLLRKTLPSEARTRRLIDGAIEGARRGKILTQRLLAFARRQELEVKPRDIVSLVRGMADLLEQSAGSRIRLSYALDETAPPAAVDANQIELALMNLVVNARDAMPDGGEIHISVDSAEEGGGADLAAGRYVRLRVTDAGGGMDAETLAKAIEPFFSTKAVGKGTGLGLSMIQGLAVQLEGTLRLRSAVGEGTTAELLLPATDAPVAADNPEPEPAPQDPAPSHFNILVVDDDPLISMSTVDMLEDLGHTVVDRNSAAEALEVLMTDPGIDLVITDYAMPRRTGLELARAIAERKPGLRVLLATGFAEPADPDRFEVPRLGKPYSQAQLREAISRTMSHV